MALDQLGEGRLGAGLHIVLKEFLIVHCAHCLLLMNCRQSQKGTTFPLGIERGKFESKRSTAPLRLLLFRQGAKQSQRPGGTLNAKSLPNTAPAVCALCRPRRKIGRASCRE